MAVIPLWRRFAPIVWFVLISVVVGVTNYLYQKNSVIPVRSARDCQEFDACADSNDVAFVSGKAGVVYANALAVVAHFVTIDTNSEKIAYRFTVTGTGRYRGNLTNLTLVVGDVTKKFEVTSVVVGLDAAFTAEDGDPSAFPFDKHSTTFQVYVVDGPLSSPTSTFVPVGFDFLGQVGSFTVDAKVSAQGNFDQREFFYAVEVVVQRSATTKFFTLVTGILQWGLALSYGLITTDIRFKGRKLEIPLVALGATLLFALPGIRNSAPNAPPIGTQMDMATLFFSVTAIGLCLIVNMCRIVYEVAAPKPAETPAKSPSKVAPTPVVYQEVSNIAIDVPAPGQAHTMYGRDDGFPTGHKYK